MVYFDIERMEPVPFGQVAEQVYFNRGGYSEEVRQKVFERVARVGCALGREAMIRYVHDGEVGGQFMAFPKNPPEVHDPIAMGV